MNKYKAIVKIIKDDEVYEFDAMIDFRHNPDDYGNGYHMGIRSKEESFGYDGYDIRYDKDFDPENIITYIVAFYAKRFSGKRDSWKLVGISVDETNEGA